MGYDLERKLREAQDELEYQNTLSRQGEAESRRLATNRYVDDDWLGFDDGRPGMSWSPFGGLHFGNWGGMPVEVWWRVAPYILFGLIGFGLWAWNSCQGSIPPASTSTGHPPAAGSTQQP
jgi:hypothetical protein